VRLFVEDFSNAKIGVSINRDSSGAPGENIVVENSVKIYNTGWVFVGFSSPAVLVKDNVYHIVVRMIPVTETENWWIQDTWTGGPGQQSWSDNTKFYENENVDWSQAGKIRAENVIYVGLPPGIANHVVISEVFYDESGSDENEYIELYNPTASAVNIGGWKLKHYNETGAAQFTATIPADNFIPAYGFYLLARKSPISPNNSGVLVYPDYVYSGTMQNGPGDYLVLEDASGNYVDGMKWGNAGVAGEVYITDAPNSTSVAVDVAGGHSLERKSASTHDETKGNGYDTNNNANDTRDRATPQPQTTSSPTEDPGGTTVTAYRNGWFTSSVYDAGSSSAHWVYIDWTASVPTGTSLTVKVRFDNSSSGILSKPWVTVSNSQTLDNYARYAQYRAEFSATDNNYTAELDKIRLQFGLPSGGAGPENYYVTSEPSPLADGSSRVGVVLSGSYSNTQTQDGVYEKIGEVSLGAPATETDNEAATQVVAGTEVGGTSTNNLDADDAAYYEVDAASSGGGGGTQTLRFCGFDAGDNWSYTTDNSGIETWTTWGPTTTLPRTGSQSWEAVDLNDTGNENGIIIFDSIDVSSYDNVWIKLWINGNPGAGFEDTDSIGGEISINGGAWTSFFFYYGISIPTTWTEQTYNVGDSATTVQLRIKMSNNATDEKLYLDDVSLTGNPPSSTYSLDVRHDSGQVTASQSTV
ncbi:MAG: lamin tail domain-containing protein, partial [Candidatus Hadarchaeales archaeon]